MLWRWFQDWRDRRSTLAEIRQLGRADEALLMDQNDNPISLAKRAVEAGNPTEAVAQWDRARLLVPNAVVENPDSLDILLGLKRYDEADALMRQRQKRHPLDRTSLEGLARIAEERGDIAEALKRWEVVRSRVLDNIYGYHGCARCLLALGRLDEAEAQWDAALRRGSYNRDACIGRAMVSDRRKDWEESLRRWRHIVDTFGFAPSAASYAKVLMELGRDDEAEVWLEQKSRDYPGDLEIAVARTQLARHRGDLAAACERWAFVRATHPYLLAAWYEGAHCLAAAERHAEADAVLRSAIERFPDQSWPLDEFARLAHHRRDWNEAAARWEALRRQFPEVTAGYTAGAEALKAAGRDAEADALLRAPC
jgi:tetratricopeptide (TPR) repeat protein